MPELTIFEKAIPDEDHFINSYLSDLDAYQNHVADKKNGGMVSRAFHAKTIAGAQAHFRVADNLPKEMQSGLFACPGKLDAVVRFSSGQSFDQPDFIPDGRGMAVKILGVTGEPCEDAPLGVQDFLSFNGYLHSIRDGVQFAKLSLLAKSMITAPYHILKILPPRDLIKVFTGYNRLTLNTFNSLPSSSYYGLAPISFAGRPAKFSWNSVPTEKISRVSPGRNALADDLFSCLISGDLVFDLCVQLHIDDTVTPVEDLTVEWDAKIAPWQRVGRLCIHQVESRSAFETNSQFVEELAFSPWNALAAHRPLGSVQRVRRQAYKQSAARRKAKILTGEDDINEANIALKNVDLAGVCPFRLKQKIQVDSRAFDISSTWVIPAPTSQIIDLLKHENVYRKIFSGSIIRSELVSLGDENGVGRVTRLHTKGLMPHSFQFLAKLAHLDDHSCIIEVQGDFEGTAIISFFPEETHTRIKFRWMVDIRHPLISAIAMRFKTIFIANHRYVMRRCERAFRRALEAISKGGEKTALENIQFGRPSFPHGFLPQERRTKWRRSASVWNE